MFKSRLRDLVIPQAEHARLAGTLANLWGNARFEKPLVDFMSFVTGVTTHDRGYGMVDTLAIGGLTEPQWLEVTRKGFFQGTSDPVADLVVRHHLRRLVRGSAKSAGTVGLLAEMDAAIEADLQKSGLSAIQWEHIDRVTNLCDMIAFDFSFESPHAGSIEVAPAFAEAVNTAPVHYEILAGGTIDIFPWPFSVASYSGFVIGYETTGYPLTLNPVIVPFEIVCSRD